MTRVGVDALPEQLPLVSVRQGAGHYRAVGRLARRRVVVGFTIAAVTFVLWHGWWGSDQVVNAFGWVQLRSALGAATHPRLDGEFLEVVARAALTSVEYALVGTALAVGIGLVGGVVTSDAWWRTPGRRRSTRPAAQRFLCALLAVPRAIHEAIWALMLVFVLGRDPLVAVLAIGIPFGAITAKVVADALDTADQAPVTGLRAAGAGRLSAVSYALLPLVRSDLGAYGLYRLECALRSSVVLGAIGAGGIGFEIAVSFQSLRYSEIWTLIYALVAMSWLLGRWGEHRPPRSRTWLVPAAVTAATIAAAVHLGVTPTTLLDDRTARLARQLAAEAFPPRLPTGGWSALFESALATIELSILAMVVAIGFGLPMAALGARVRGRSRPARWGGGLVRFAALGLRAVPPTVWALLVLFVVYPGPLAGGIALGIYTAGVLTRLCGDVVERADRRPLQSLQAAGATSIAAQAYGLWPVVAPRITALATYRWEVAARETVIVGLVGAGGLGRMLAEQNAAQSEAQMVVTVVALIGVSACIEAGGRQIRRALA